MKIDENKGVLFPFLKPDKYLNNASIGGCDMHFLSFLLHE